MISLMANKNKGVEVVDIKATPENAEMIKSRNYSMITSVLILSLVFSGAHFEPDVKIQVVSIKLNNPQFLWFLLVLFWLYFTNRFYVYAKSHLLPNIHFHLTKKASDERLMFKIFPPTNYFSDVNDVRWSGLPEGWVKNVECCNDSSTLSDDRCSYIFRLFDRGLEFSYYVPGERYVHFVDSKRCMDGHENGRVSLLSLNFLKIKCFEIKVIIKLWNQIPDISTYYLPMFLVKVALLSIVYQIYTIIW